MHRRFGVIPVGSEGDVCVSWEGDIEGGNF